MKFPGNCDLVNSGNNEASTQEVGEKGKKKVFVFITSDLLAMGRASLWISQVEAWVREASEEWTWEGDSGGQQTSKVVWSPHHLDLLNQDRLPCRTEGLSPPFPQCRRPPHSSSGEVVLSPIGFRHFVLLCVFLDSREMIHDNDVPICHLAQRVLGLTSKH